jgi:dienelactone hydrolase
MRVFGSKIIIFFCAIVLYTCQEGASGLNVNNNSTAEGPFGADSLNPEQAFQEADSPKVLTHKELLFKSPWGYEKSGNESRHYPLLVSGMWGEGESQYNKVNQDYHAFVLDYQKKTSADGAALASWIRSAISEGYRIDTNRIYLTGFSYGGSSSYPLAKGMYEEDMYFAALIRVAGQSQSDIGNEIAQKTAVWYHIGLEDTETRVEVARQALENMRQYESNAAAIEQSHTDTITGYDRVTVTLTRDEKPMFKYSEYTGMGHSPGACYKDEYLFYWLFNHSLQSQK